MILISCSIQSVWQIQAIILTSYHKQGVWKIDSIILISCCIQGVGNGILRGMGRQKLGTVFNACAFGGALAAGIPTMLLTDLGILGELQIKRFSKKQIVLYSSLLAN